MIERLRHSFNQQFSTNSYREFLAKLKANIGVEPSFRVAESPVFLPADLVEKLKSYSNELIKFSCDPATVAQTENSIPADLKMPNEGKSPHFICVDFGITELEDGTLEPKLIEIQGFPSLFTFQLALYDTWKSALGEEDLTAFFDMDRSAYVSFLEKMFTAPGTVVLEIEPEKQNTYIDLYLLEKEYGAKILCVTEVFQEGDALYYMEGSAKKKIQRILNRVIFDELNERKDLNLRFDFTAELDVEWITNTNWFYRISKYTLPLMDFEYVPKSYYLADLKELPKNMEDFVLKPLFSFSGAGVLIDVTKEDVEAIKNPSNYMLQEKVNYAPILESTNGKVKMEIRVLAARTDDMDLPIPLTNIIRLTRGKMVGVKYNKNMDWVGGSIGLFKK